MSASANGSGITPSVSSTSLLELRPARLQSFFHGAISIKEEGGAAADTDAHDDGDEAPNAQAELERQLRISARIGLGLLEKTESLEADNEALRIKHREQEASISQLLDRLAQSYKENAQLIKRAERAQANLDASEASNRQLLITLEEDRKTVKRLSAVRARSPSGHEQSLELEDLRQELNAERRRASAAEARAKRATTKLADNESRLSTISQQLDKAKLERNGRQSISAGRNRSRPSSISVPRTPTSPETETAELRKVLESLRFENEVMQTDMQQLQEILHNSQDQVTYLQAEQTDRAAFVSSDDERESRHGNASLASEVLLSPDIDGGPENATSTAPTSVVGTEWMPTPQYQTSSIMMGRLPHTSTDSSSTASNAGSSKLGMRRKSSQRGVPSAALRRMGGRAMSVDLSNMMQRRLEDLEYDYTGGRTPSPGANAHPASPLFRPLALGTSVNSLSSSLGTPALPTAHEDAEEAEESIQEGPTILEIGPSPIKTPHEGDGGLTRSSPRKSKHRRGTVSEVAPSLPVETREIAIQTEDVSPNQAQTSTARSIPPALQQRPQFQQYPSSIVSSDAASEHESSDAYSNGRHQPLGAAADVMARGSRTAALGALLEHVGRLLTKLKGADVLSLEQRLKKQNLPGDVGHLAKSNMRDILQEIEGMRTYFRQVLDSEAAGTDSASATAGDEGLMARKDFIMLVKLFRDILYELGRLRTIVNRVEIEPALASKLRDFEGLQSPTDLLSAGIPANTDRSAAAAILAPFSRLFSYGTDAQPAACTPHPVNSKAVPGGSKARPAARPVPKLSASSALATATVNVEFGGQGGVRRQVSIMPQDGDGGLAGRYQNSIGRSGGAGSSRPSLGVPGQRQGVNRQLSSIFAGGGGMHSPTADPWVVLPGGQQAPQSRQTSSSYRANQRGPSNGAPQNRQSIYQGMSQNVDAVIDNNGAEGEDFRPNLLERTLRPRGLSDSSIHSTFMNHANPAGRLLTPAGLALSSTTAHTDGDRTVRATLAKSNTGAARPSILSVGSRDGVLRKISNSMKSYTSGSGESSAANDGRTSPLPSPAAVEDAAAQQHSLRHARSSDRLSPRRGVRATSTSAAAAAASVSASAAATPIAVLGSSGDGQASAEQQLSKRHAGAVSSGSLFAGLGAWTTSRGGSGTPGNSSSMPGPASYQEPSGLAHRAAIPAQPSGAPAHPALSRRPTRDSDF